MKNEMARNVDKVLRKFEEKNSVFDSVSRQKIQRAEAKLKVGPPLGKYTPKYDAIDTPVKAPIFNKSHRMSADIILLNQLPQNTQLLTQPQSFRAFTAVDDLQNPSIMKKHHSITKRSINSFVDTRVMINHRCIRSLKRKDDNNGEDYDPSNRDSIDP